MKRFVFYAVISTLKSLGLGQTKLYIPKLNSQYNKEINWKQYKCIIIGSKGSGDFGREWGEKLSENVPKDQIGIIASVPRWMISPIGSKYIIKQSI